MAERRKLDQIQKDVLRAQRNIEARRGAVEGDKYVEPVTRDIGSFISQKRGTTIRYSHLKDDGEIGKIALVNNGKKQED